MYCSCFITVKTGPSILYNHLKLTADNDIEAPADVNSGPSQSTTWSNIASPSSVHYKFTVVNEPSETNPASDPTSLQTSVRQKKTPRVTPPHAFIEHFEVGIVNAWAKFRLLRETKLTKVIKGTVLFTHSYDTLIFRIGMSITEIDYLVGCRKSANSLLVMNNKVNNLKEFKLRNASPHVKI